MNWEFSIQADSDEDPIIFSFGRAPALPVMRETKDRMLNSRMSEDCRLAGGEKYVVMVEEILKSVEKVAEGRQCEYARS